jgi:hypothetical protein
LQSQRRSQEQEEGVEYCQKYKLRQHAEAKLETLWDRERAGVQVTR